MEHEELPNKVGKSATKIWEAYQEVLAELKAKEAAPPSIAAVAEAQKAEAAIKLAREVDVDTTATTAETIATGLREAKAEFDEVEAAIEKAKAELENVHGIQVEADSLAALVAAKDRLVAEREEKAKVILDGAREEAAQVKEDAQAEADKLRTDAQEADRIAERDRQRTQAEWDYDFGRKKKTAIDEVQDAIDVKRKSLDAREANLTERESQADEIEKEKADLQAEIDALKADVERQVQAAAEKAETKAKQGFNFQKQIIEKDLQSKLDIANAHIASLEKQNADLQARLDKADEQIAAAHDRVSTIAQASLKAQGDAQTISKVAEVAAGAGPKK